MKKTLIIIAVILNFLSTTSLADGKAYFNAFGCTSCHGASGISVAPAYPNLAGQKAAYIIKQLKHFQSGVRKDPSMTAMSTLVKGKEQEIADYLESLK